MTDQPSLDRRDFMFATSLATIGGAATSIILSSDHAEAQTAATTLAGGTVYTGDFVHKSRSSARSVSPTLSRARSIACTSAVSKAIRAILG